MGYGSDLMVEQAEEEAEENREKWIRSQARLGVMSTDDLQQLYHEMQNDRYSGDADMEFNDPTINDRLASLNQARADVNAKRRAKRAAKKNQEDDLIEY